MYVLQANEKVGIQISQYPKEKKILTHRECNTSGTKMPRDESLGTGIFGIPLKVYYYKKYLFIIKVCSTFQLDDAFLIKQLTYKALYIG